MPSRLQLACFAFWHSCTAGEYGKVLKLAVIVCTLPLFHHHIIGRSFAFCHSLSAHSLSSYNFQTQVSTEHSNSQTFIMRSHIIAVAFGASLALAKTDLGGCTSTATRDQYGDASVLWYLPSDGEICEPLDCGGGRAPPKTDVPGCPLYSGTASYTPSFLPGYGEASATPSESSIIMSATTSWDNSMPTSDNWKTNTLSPYSSGSSWQTTQLTTAAPVQTSAVVVAPAPSAGTTTVAGSNFTTSGSPSSPSASPSAFDGAANTMTAGVKGVVGIAVGVLIAAVAL